MSEISEKCHREINIKLGELLCQIANLATGIRMNSKYNPSSIENPKTPEAVMWLSDALHNLDRLGNALAQGST